MLRESRLLLKEAKRILRKYRARISEELSAEVRRAMDDLQAARKTKEYRRVRNAAEKLDDLLEKHLSYGRKSAVREYAESIGIAVLIALLLRAFVVEAFKIPSGSMIPTLKIGDHIFVNKFIYGLQIPFTAIKFFQRSPERGDVIVFIYPEDPKKDFIKRVVAIGGDTIAVKRNVVYVNGKKVERKKLDIPCQFVQADEDGRLLSIDRCAAYQETLGDHEYRVIQSIRSEEMAEIDLGDLPSTYPPRKIPKGHVFVMGDNRDNSHDSRRWGTVPLNHIKGKALIIWWSSGVPAGVRWERFFDLVHRLPGSKEPILP